MKPLYEFIVTPIGDRYDNVVNVDNKELILNNNVENFKFINRKALVVATPKAYNTPIEEEDEVIIHHNIFRSYYNLKGKKVNSSKFLRDDYFFCNLDQIYLYKKVINWTSFGDRFFVMPIKNNDSLSLEKEKKNTGIIKYGNPKLEAKGIKEGDLVGFLPNREFEFIVDDQRLYCLHINDILIKYEYKGDEEEYNPSWAKSS